MKKLVTTIIITTFIALSIPAFGEEKSTDAQMELIRIKLENVQLREALIAREFKDLRALKAQLVAQLKELQVQKEIEKKKELEKKKEKKIEEKDTGEE